MSHRSWSKSQKSSEKTAFNESNERKAIEVGAKYWTKEQWRKVVFSDESHLFVQGHRSQHVRGSSEEKIRVSHIN